MPHDDDFTVEPIKGLPERPPSGEEILWQGKPRVYALAREAMSLHWVIGYFVFLAFWRVGVSSAGMPFSEALVLGVPFVILGAVAAAMILGLAWVLARTTVYTVTTSRVALRVGAALTVTLNLPFKRIASADLNLRRDGTGTIAFDTLGETRLSYLVLWPHVRPWHMKKTQPALRAIPDAERVARLIAATAETRVSQPEISLNPDAAAPVAAE